MEKLPPLTLARASALLGGEVTAVQPFESAGIGTVQEVTTASGDVVVVKQAPPAWHWSIDKEAALYRLVVDRGLEVPTPRVLGTPESGTLVLERLPGDVSGFATDTDELYGRLGALLRLLHEITFDSFGYLGARGVVEPHATNLDYMRFQFQRKLLELEEHGERSLSRRIAAHVAEREELLAHCELAVLCHDDGHEGNVLVEHDATGGWRISGLIDFQNAVAGDPLLDLAKTYCYSNRRSESMLAALVAGHGGLGDRWRDPLDLYVLYHRLELWAWFASLGVRDPLDALAAELRESVA
jgi:aminoglycoside phosphotransferase (APT) family kinase protein